MACDFNDIISYYIKNTTMDDKHWIRLGVYVRIALIALMLLIGIEMLYFKFGYVNPDDAKMTYDLGNITREVTCRDALYYYADKEWHINEVRPNNYTIPDLNFSLIS